MFDAKSLLDNIVRGAGGSQGIGQQSGGAGGLEDLIRQMLPSTGNNAPAVAADSPTSGGALNDIISQIQSKVGQAGGSGGILDTLGQVFGQAVQGTREGAQRIGEATGTSTTVDDLLARLPPDAVRQVKDFIANNPLAAGAALGGLGGLILGTGTGRSLATGAVKLGAAALIGGLAYKAYQNYQSGKPVLTGGDAAVPATAPAGSGFEPSAISDTAAKLMIRAMIAAAAADGRVDDAEQAALTASLKQAGLDREAEGFIADELNRPASVAELAAGVTSPEQALQIYTAARIAIEPDSDAEKVFLSNLAASLGIAPELAAHVDATARGASAAA